MARTDFSGMGPEKNTTMKSFRLLSITAIILWGVLWDTGTAIATQSHGEPEGLVIHQIAHLFFMFSLGTLVYWLRARRLTTESGWRYIQYGAMLLIIWNLDAFSVHTLGEFIDILEVERHGSWDISIRAAEPYKLLEVVYYLIKLDHLFSVPAMLLLYLGLKRLAGEGEGEESNGSGV